MKCPSCGERLAARTERCPACGAVIAPRVEGALAPNPRTATPPPQDRVEPLRDIPALRKRERTWRDEVRERVRSRRRRKAEAGLPLFEQPEVETTPEPPDAESAEAPSTPVAPEPEERPLPPGRDEPLPVRLRSQPDFVAAPLSEEELADLPLRPAERGVDARAEREDVAVPGPSQTPALDEDLVPGGGEPAAEEVSLSPSLGEPGPLERPARPGERAQAAAVDAGLLTVLGVLVLYFTGRAARVDLLALVPSWPWLLSYLALLGLFYAGYFTGTTGQTPGKMVTGLRVVDALGRPPGYVRAVVRAAAGALGTLGAGLGLIPMAFDPARRALHDRLLHTRVVRR